MSEAKSRQGIFVGWAIVATVLALTSAFVSLGLTVFLLSQGGQYAIFRRPSAIISILKPPNSNDGVSRPGAANAWSVSIPPRPLKTEWGIGYIVNNVVQIESVDVPDYRDLTIHDHIYAGSYIPDPTRGVVTYEFDRPTVVGELEVVQHKNGITQIEGFVGDTLESLISIGNVFGPRRDTIVQFSEGEHYTFAFSNLKSGLYFRFVIRKAASPEGYALYRAYPRTPSGLRIPPAGSH